MADAATKMGIRTHLVGNHPAVQRVRDLVERAAPTDATVLILGESGTGKEVVARMVHEASRRAGGPFVAVNCGAIPADLLESELFGHERGAFTGAVASREGLFQQAAGGTIFLDEVAEMPPALQVKLLRVLQEREVRPVGGARPLRVDVRVVAATNKDLAARVRTGEFREDLFYRLQVIPVAMPALRERRSDIPALVRHFLDRHNADRPLGEQVCFSDGAMSRLWAHGWPGNVRELENAVERMVILGESAGDGPASSAEAPSADVPVALPSALPEEGLDLARYVEEIENRFIDEAMRRTSGNKQAAGRLLGLKRTTLVAKLRRRGEVVDASVETARAAQPEAGRIGLSLGESADEALARMPLPTTILQ